CFQSTIGRWPPPSPWRSPAWWHWSSSCYVYCSRNKDPIMPDKSLPRLQQAALLRALSGIFVIALVVYILLPVIVTLISSFNASRHLRFPISDWSFRWHIEFFR